jgi:hypothetical protein
MLTHESNPFQTPAQANVPHSSIRRRTPRRDDYPTARVIIGPPIGDGRVAYVQQLDASRTPAAIPATAPEVLVSLFGQRPGGNGNELLLHVAVRRCDLWNGDFDDRLKVLVLWTGWAVTRIERRELEAYPP